LGDTSVLSQGSFVLTYAGVANKMFGMSMLNAGNAAIQATRSTTLDTNLLSFNFTTGNVTAIGNVIAPNYLFANGVNILSTVTGGAGTYSNADVVSMLAANTAVFVGNTGVIGNVATGNIQANATAIFLRGNTVISNYGSPTFGYATHIGNNIYFDANGVQRYRNTQTGASDLIVGPGTLYWYASGGAVTANAATGYTGGTGVYMGLSTSSMSLYQGIGLVSSGPVTIQSATGLVTNQSTLAIFNGVGTTLNYGGVATTMTFGAANGVTTFNANTGGIVYLGNIIASGNVTAGNVLGTHYGNAIGTTSTYTGNITVGNVVTTGNLYGNVVGIHYGNIVGTTSTLTGNITASYITANVTPAITSTPVTGVGYIGMPQNATGSTTLTIADAGRHIYVTSTGQTITIPANSSVAYPIGTTIAFVGGPSATTTTIAITTDTMYLAGTGTTGSRTLAAYGMATAVKVAATTWYINGSGLT
jgi:hypothetical protein